MTGFKGFKVIELGFTGVKPRPLHTIPSQPLP